MTLQNGCRGLLWHFLSFDSNSFSFCREKKSKNYLDHFFCVQQTTQEKRFEEERALRANLKISSPKSGIVVPLEPDMGVRFPILIGTAKMIDTLRLEIKNISPGDMEIIKSNLVTHYTVSNIDGVIQSQFTKGSLRGSWDYNIRVFVRDSVFQSIEVEDKPLVLGNPRTKRRYQIKRTSKKTIAVSCPEYLVIEFSLPKWAEGHNLLNSDIIQDLVRLIQFRKWFSIKVGVVLPPLENWDVVRCDIGQNYQLMCLQAVKSFIDIHGSLRYPRRKKPQVYDTSVRWPGQTAIKIYSKGAEFKEHDIKRLKTVYDKEKLKLIQVYADELLRLEIELRKERLQKLGIQTVKDLFNTTHNLGGIMINEYKKLTDDAENSKVYNYQEAMKTINEGHFVGCGVSRMAAGVIWVSLATQGLTYANKTHGERMVRRARTFFKKIGLSCLSNLQEVEIQYDYRKFNIIELSATDAFLRKKIAEILPYPTHDYYYDYQKIVVGF